MNSKSVYWFYLSFASRLAGLPCLLSSSTRHLYAIKCSKIEDNELNSFHDLESKLQENNLCSTVHFNTNLNAHSAPFLSQWHALLCLSAALETTPEQGQGSC